MKFFTFLSVTSALSVSCPNDGMRNSDVIPTAISAGSSVTWINDGEKGMVVIIFKDGGSYTNSQTIKPGEKFEHEFTEAGEYEYWQNIAFGGDSSKITVE